jgi:hypothetical protein
MLRRNGSEALVKQTDESVSGPGELSAPVTYSVAGREFTVEPVFKEQSSESIGSILLKLIAEEAGNR